MAHQIVLFDVGHVIVDWDPTRLYAQLMNSQDAANRFYNEVCTLEWHTEHDRGVPMDENARHLIQQYPQHEELIRAWKTGWLEMIHGYVPGVPEIISELKNKGTPLYALTNFPAEKWDETAEAYPVLKVFEDVIISGVEKCVKPEPRIYDIALKRIAPNSPSDIIFFDDRPANVESAIKAGMRASVFTDADKMRKDLEACGLL
jgi:2-haloacid dehalogenase